MIPKLLIRVTNTAGQMVEYPHVCYNEAKLEFVALCMKPWIVRGELFDLKEGSEPVRLAVYPKGDQRH